VSDEFSEEAEDKNVKSPASIWSLDVARHAAHAYANAQLLQTHAP
jgi:hypothetical protein